MASTTTQTGSRYVGKIKKLVLNWLSDASAGTVAYTTTEKWTGELIGVEFITGSVTPTDLYDVTILDDQGQDILGGVGANIVVATGKSSQVISSGIPFPPVVNSVLALAVANAGNAKTGKVVLTFADAKVKGAY